jgi:hypothetical protein
MQEDPTIPCLVDLVFLVRPLEYTDLEGLISNNSNLLYGFESYHLVHSE